jgi:ATP-dependent Clp protease ATP-binding subunit ClpC
VDFGSTVVVLASNLGAEAFQERHGRSVGFGRAEERPDRSARALELAKDAFPPELWSRIEERLVFAPLTRDDVRRIVHLLATESGARLAEDQQIRFELDPESVEYLLDHGGWDESTGARGLRQTLSRLVEGPLAERILRHEIGPGDRIRVTARRGTLDFEQLTVIVPAMRAP